MPSSLPSVIGDIREMVTIDKKISEMEEKKKASNHISHMLRYLSSYNLKNHPSSAFPFHALQLAQDLATQGYIWTSEDVELTFSWLQDLQRVGYNFPSLESICVPSVPEPITPVSNTPYAIAQPVNLLKQALTNSQQVTFFSSEASKESWKEWLREEGQSFAVRSDRWVLDEFEGTVVINVAEVSLEGLWRILNNSIDHADYIIIYHSLYTFCPPCCGEDKAMGLIKSIVDIVENLLTLHRSWDIKWEPLVPGKMSFPSPWILHHKFKEKKDIIDALTTRQFRADCTEDLVWFLSYYLRVGSVSIVVLTVS